MAKTIPQTNRRTSLSAIFSLIQPGNSLILKNATSKETLDRALRVFPDQTPDGQTIPGAIASVQSTIKLNRQVYSQPAKLRLVPFCANDMPFCILISL